MVVLSREDPTLLVVTEGGMGKRTAVDAYRFQGRGGKGVINIKTSEKTGKVVTIKSVIDDDELMFITRNGVVNRQRVAEIRTIGRATQGVRLVNLDEGDRVMDVARVIREEEEAGLTGLAVEAGGG
jgi:DNA gyrase subunit A